LQSEIKYAKIECNSRRIEMILVNGTYTQAVVYRDSIDEESRNQISEICSHMAMKNSVIRIMPDCHAGNSCVIGFTAVLNEKKIIPNIVGVDIGCGVMATVFRTENEIDFRSLDEYIRRTIPSGMEVREFQSEYVTSEIIDSVEYICNTINENNKRDFFINSIGTLGSGNHFIEIDRISENTYLLAVHTGSRGLGLRVCRYFQNCGSTIDEELKHQILEKHKSASTAEEHSAIQNEVNNLTSVRKELAFISGSVYDSYVECMHHAMEYAKLNRSSISDEIMHYLTENEAAEIIERFDTIHNYIDRYDSEGRIIIRKGSVSAEAGERISIPLNMRDGIIIGTGKGNPDWNNSAPHGSGRAMSRTQARQNITLEQYESSMSGISTWSVCESTIDESPFAYKPTEEIIAYLSDTVDIDFVAKTIYNFKAEL
jgi:RNA-splicing ligase RtcB